MQTITVKGGTNDDNKAVTSNHQSSWVFGFNQVFENVSQEAMFDACAKDIVDSVISGYNGTLFACKYTFVVNQAFSYVASRWTNGCG